MLLHNWGKLCFLSMQEDLLTELLQKNGGKGQLLLLLSIEMSLGV